MRYRPSRPSQRGVTLIEVMVALLIFALGLLGSAGLVLSSLQAGKYSNNSVMATTMAREYGELMQMIPDAVSPTSKAGSSTAGTLLLDTDSLAAGDANSCTGATKTCTPAQMVAAVRSDWGQRVKSTAYLPEGRALVCRDSSPRDAAGKLDWGGCDGAGDTVLIKMGWLGKQAVGTKDPNLDTTWETESDRARFALSIVGNLRDYAHP